MTPPPDTSPRHLPHAADATFLDLNLGMAFKVWKLVIPVDLRVGFNLSQGSNYADRITLPTSTSARIAAVESYQFTLLAGVAYAF